MASAGAGPSKWQRVAEEASLDSLPPDVLENILHLGDWLSPNPMFDRGDILRDACALACMGNATCTELAQRLFAELSPRLGQELPLGVTPSSSAAELKKACKEWGLAVSGTKADLFQRLLDQVQDSEEGEGGKAPKHCLVSGATRQELAGWSQRRITLSKAKEIFNLWKSEIESCSYIVDNNNRGGFGPSKQYLLSEVKAKARARHKTWAALTGQKERWKVQMDGWKEEAEKKRNQRLAELRAELRSRGHSAAQVESVMARSPGVGYCTWGSGDKLSAQQAVDHMERLYFCVASEERESYFALRFHVCTYQPPRTESKYKTREKKLEMAANDTLRAWVHEYGSLQELQGDPDLPVSLRPLMERLWGEAQAGAKPPMPMGLAYYEEEDYYDGE